VLKLPGASTTRSARGWLEQLREEQAAPPALQDDLRASFQALDVGAFTTPEGVWVPYLVLEWLEGETLAEHLKARQERGEGGYSLAEAVKLLEPAARALAVAHKQKVAHRDVKPPNLFVTRNNGEQTVKVLDFGIAKVLTTTRPSTEAWSIPSRAHRVHAALRRAEQFNKQRGASGP